MASEGASAGAGEPQLPPTPPALAKRKRERAAEGVRVVFGPVHDRNIESLKMLMRTILPVYYNDDFYKKILKTPPEFTKIAYMNEVFVGAVCCRVEQDPKGIALSLAAKARLLDVGPVPTTKLYCMTLGVLAPYRGLGIGSDLVQSVLDEANKKASLTHMYLHVHTANEEAIKFYTERFGFHIAETIKDYYRRITPPDCHVLVRDLEAGTAAYNAARQKFTEGGGKLEDVKSGDKADA